MVEDQENKRGEEEAGRRQGVIASIPHIGALKMAAGTDVLTWNL